MEKKPLDNILTFLPYYKSVIWGGERISKLKGESISSRNIGESWEISAVPGHESVVADGEFKGLTISDLVRDYGENLLGTKVVSRYGNKFPLLIKLLDAHDILSLQVHPDDRIAERLHCSRGKSEMWYVIDAKPGASIYCGFSEPVSPDSFDRHISEKSIMDVIASYPSRSGQFYFIPAGTIHSVGPGNLIAEIQESSDITYRVFDHDRKDASGQQRELHIAQARIALDYSFPHTVTPTAQAFGQSTADAVVSEHFRVDYYNVNGHPAVICSDHSSFTALLVTDGKINIDADGMKKTVSKGHTVLIPASVGRIILSGDGIAIAAHI